MSDLDSLLDTADRIVATDLYPARCRTVIAALAASLRTMAATCETITGIGFDAPATWAGTEEAWERSRANKMQQLARAALSAYEESKE